MPEISTVGEPRKIVTFTRDEIKEALGIDLDDCFYANLSFHDNTLTFYYSKGK
jgi:hypothetical protein